MSDFGALAGRLRLAISRAVVALVSDDKKLQELQITLHADEARGAVERFQQYGFTSVPLEGAEAIALSVAGSRGHMVVIAVDDRRYRKKDLQPGESAIYSDEGDYVLLKRGRIVEVNAGTRLNVIAPEAVFSGNVHVAGSITCAGNVSDLNGSMQEMRDTYNAHTHAGVQAGTASTAVPTQGMT